MGIFSVKEKNFFVWKAHCRSRRLEIDRIKVGMNPSWWYFLSLGETGDRIYQLKIL